MTYRQLIETNRNKLTSITDAREALNLLHVLLEDSFGIDRPKLRELYDNEVDDELLQKLNVCVDRLLANEPVQYITGKAFFYKHFFKVDSRVLIPRPETEELVSWILSKEPTDALDLLDIGTGSGCIPISLKMQRRAWNIKALDVSGSALQVAKANAVDIGADISFVEQDILDSSLWDRLPQMDVIVSNPPYITEEELKEIAPHVLDHEPLMALIASGNDALIFYRAIAELAMHKALVAGGRIYFEMNTYQHQGIYQIVAEAGYKDIEVVNDLQGLPRMLRAVRP